MCAGAVTFADALSENCLEECAVSDDIVSPEEEGICESAHFTETGMAGSVRSQMAAGLLRLLESCVTNLYRAQMYEAMHEIYEIMMRVQREHVR